MCRVKKMLDEEKRESAEKYIKLGTVSLEDIVKGRIFH